MLKRGEDKMTKVKTLKDSVSPIIKITLLNYESTQQFLYSQKFMFSLFDSVLKHTQLVEAQ